MLKEKLAYSISVQDSRWRQIAERYVADIHGGRLGPGDRLPSDAALAEITGVSRVTAHKALAELHRLGLVTRDGRRGTIVSSKAEQSTGRIALVLDQVALHRDFPRADLLGGLHEGLGQSHSLLWCDSMLDADRESDFLQRMPKETDGIICWPTGHSQSTAALNDLPKRNVPLVLIDRIPKDVHAHAVISDSASAAREALKFLVDRGHRRIALLAFDKPHVSAAVERVRAYNDFMVEHDLPTAGIDRRFPAALEFDPSGWFNQAVHDTIFTLVKSPEPITAILCAQDMFCAAALSAVDRIGLAIPDDLEIASFNDWPLQLLGRPWQVHRIHTQAAEIGRTAAKILRSQIAGEWTVPAVHRIPAIFVPADAGISQLSPDRSPQ